ncbi:metalloregulator ArsR/SmtB family transcription factor [Gemmiger sp.]|uniref:ArsR/SmtB family transcription factor n=1 Tax=Gemmiger sp. TaxID=2049027 RepID=UPI002A749B28|nr:metalloregulator ArsR/SmtB family transcription factor [Gemmiger sp.]MDY2695061.1 metalloregulator ArsR/SmtB family transcription factor [Gemmiger sp.]MDY6007224.1 metalloregulator ArsR/SmtB family transcription factor [Gemmiger sp.]
MAEPEKIPDAPALADAVLNRLQNDLPDDEVLYELAELFRVFGDSTRIKILYALFESEKCVNDISNAVGISQSAVSHQLRVLRASKLVKFRREGKAMLYSLDDDHVRSMLELGMEHVEE